MFKFTYNGHDYNYDFENNTLINIEGVKVARVELAADSNFDEYNYFIHIESNEVMQSIHENEILFSQNHVILAGLYESFYN